MRLRGVVLVEEGAGPTEAFPGRGVLGDEKVVVCELGYEPLLSGFSGDSDLSRSANTRFNS